MAVINKAILHILDFNSGVTVFSQSELDLKIGSVETFLAKHLEKSYCDQSCKTGSFYSSSAFRPKLAAYLESSLSFIDFSVYIAELMYAAIVKSDNPVSADLLVCDFSMENERSIGILKCNNRAGFTHHVVQDETGVRNEIINHYAIMPGISQKIDEFAFIETDSLNIKFVDKKRLIDGQEAFIIADSILQCSSKVSPKDTLSLVGSITRSVAENHGQNSILAVSKAKSYIADNTEVSDYLDPVALGKEVFSDYQPAQEEYLKEIHTAGIQHSVKVDKNFALRRGKSHKIVTDTGIEVTFPAEYFQNTDFIEFINNPDGTLSIELKNISKLTNK